MGAKGKNLAEYSARKSKALFIYFLKKKKKAIFGDIQLFTTLFPKNFNFQIKKYKHIIQNNFWKVLLSSA